MRVIYEYEMSETQCRKPETEQTDAPEPADVIGSFSVR
jgi:hypothetical protein